MRTKKKLTRSLSVLLTLAMLLSIFPTQALAYKADKQETISIVDSAGKTVTVDGSWATAFPYGTFAFAASTLKVDEGGEGKITVYRLGGTKGRATAKITYVPAVAEIEAGVKTYANAAGSQDVSIRVEDPLSIARYQPVGKDPDPLRPESSVAVLCTESGDTPGDVTLTVDIEAASYQWYILTGGYWEMVTGANQKKFVASDEHYEAYDFRCVYTVGGVTYCSDSAKGTAYVRPEQEVLPEQPADLELNPEPSYTLLPMDDPNEYAGYVFELTFAEDEWVKDIYVSSPEDDTAEADKFGMFTIAGCYGGSLYDTANTLMFHIADNEAPEASQIGFEVTSLLADKSDGFAYLTVRRTGDTRNVLSVAYATADGTALCGKDYSAVSGTLMFYADIKEQTIEIPLIDDKVASEEQLSFTVTLSDLKGDQAGICTLTETAAAVSLHNTATAKKANLATLLYDAEAVDLSDGVTEEEEAIAPAAGTITGEEAEDAGEPIVGTLTAESGGEIGPLTYNYPNKLSFYRGGNYAGWKDWVFVAKNKGTYNTWDVNGMDGYAGATWSGGASYGSGWKVESKGTDYANLYIPNMNQLYNRFLGRFTWRAAIGKAIYDLEYTYPWFNIVNTDWTTYASADAGTRGSGNAWKGTEITWHTSGSIDSRWDMSHQGIYPNKPTYPNRIALGLSRYDCHDATSTALGALEDGVLCRRTFSNRLALRVFTANDSGSGQNGVKTSPDGAASLTEVSGVYGSMIPRVEIVPGHGGVNNGGQLYVGSQLKVTLANTDSYAPAKEDGSLSYAVYLTNANGNVVASSNATGNIHYLTLRWDGMTNADLSGNYTVNTVMTRKQTLKVDLSPSVERLTDSNGNVLASIDPTKIGKAVDDFWDSVDSAKGITYGYSAVDNSATHFTYKTDGRFTSGSFTASGTGTAADAVLSALNVKNLQWINFNLPAEDVVLYNGRAFAGNEQIWLDVGDLAIKNMTFRYYDKEFLTAPSIMTTDISQTALYLDGNGNGRIDGWFNEYTRYFILDETSGDEFLFFLESGVDYDESVFAPVPVFGTDGSGNPVITGYRQYFLKSYYTMTPRCLTVPQDAAAGDPAQVLPAFVADVTDPNTFASLTPEQQAYRYIVSGKNRSYLPGGADHNVVTPNDNDYARSADNHLMYGSAANKVSCIDIPLGGDHNPPKLTDDKKDFTWSPDYHGNLLYRFSAPQPISIPHSLAGDNIPIAAVESIDPQTGTVTFTGDNAAAVSKLNGFLGAFSSNDTFALCVQEQKHTTEQIAAANGIDMGLLTEGDATQQPNPESSNLASSGAFPNADYLKQNSPGGDTGEPGLDMSGSGNNYEEFNLDLGVKLPSTDIGITDYVTILMDEYEVGFSIGIPLGGYNSNGDAGGGGVGGDGSGSNWYGPKKANASNAEDMGKLRDFLKSPSMDTFKATDDSYTDAKDKGKMKSSSFEVSFSISMAFLFKYNSVDNAYYFSQFSVAASAELEYKYQYRLTPCPIVYLYVTVGISVEIGTGMTVDRDTVEETGIYLPESQAFTLKKGLSYTLPTNVKAFNITFDGKLYMECFKSYTPSGEGVPASWGDPVDGFSKGYITSEGDDPVTVTLFKQDGNALSGAHYVRFTAMEDTTLTRAARIVDMRSDVYWNGFSLSPSAFVEAGAGIGVEICKFEVFIKISIGCGMALGVYNKADKTYDPFEFQEFEFALGLGFRVVLLVFSYEMDLIQYKITYDVERPEDKKWVHSWSALGGLYGGDIGTLSATDADGNTMTVHIRLPGSTAETQTIYAPPDASELSPQAYDPTGPMVPFQLSGYGSSGDAFKLVDGLVTGYDYKVVTVGDDNYLVYTIGRTADNAVDYTMLVLSKLKLTRAAASSAEKDSYGLVHPVTGAAGGYLMLDIKDDKSDDGAGDLGFTAWVKDSTIHAAWVSYAAVSAPVPNDPTEPTAHAKPVGTDGTTAMDGTNYKNAVLFPAPIVPTEPTAPTEPTEPRPDPVVTSAPTDPKPTAAPDPADTTKYSNGTADANYIADLEAYNTLVAAWAAWELQQDWNQYDSDKAAYDLAKSDYDAAKAKKDAYDAWVGYFETKDDVNAYYQTRAANAAKNTVIKTASFTVKDSYTGDESFSAAAAVSGSAGSHVFLPDSAGDGSAVFYATAVHYTAAEETAAATDYDTYLAAAYPGTDATKSIRDYRALYQKGLRDAYGKGTTLNVAIGGTTAAGSPTLSTGQTLENLEVMDAGSGVYYLAYTTGLQAYVGSGTESDLFTVRRLYLRKVTVDSTAKTAIWSDPYLLRTLGDSDRKNDTDGVYAGSAVSSPYDNPYFANLQFLCGKLGTLTNGEDLNALEIQPQDFLLFEMNGATYIIPSVDLDSITGSGTGKIYPFFKPETEGDASSPAAKASSAGRAEVTIGADGAGNIAAVYVGAVPSTTNNALFLTKYDPNTSSWGSGTMLAMNYMQVHEDSITKGWTAAETEAAFLGTRPDGTTGGGMDQFIFSNLQIALGQKKTDLGSTSMGALSETAAAESAPADPTLLAQYGLTRSELSVLGEEEEAKWEAQLSGLGNSQMETLAGETTATQDTLLVITQGAMTYLEHRQYDTGEVDGDGHAILKTVLAPLSAEAAQNKYNEPLADKNRKPGVGFYAVSYGVGGQRIGEDRLTFVDYDFTTGSELKSTVSFVNTGDVTIRGSLANPITVKLKVITPGGADTELDTWTISGNIAAGQKVELCGTANALAGTLPTGSVFYLTVSEDAPYITSIGGTPFAASTLVKDESGNPVSGTLKVAQKPELGFESCKITSTGVDANGNTILTVEFQVGNRGNQIAEGVYVQFTYEDGMDTHGKPRYAALNLTGHNLIVSKQAQLKTMAASSAVELQSGILRLYNAEDGDSIGVNHGRTVTGTITVPPACYKGGITGSLNLNLEVFSGTDTITVLNVGVVTAKHDEYNSVNNAEANQIEQTTYFATADKVTLAMGNTMRLPVSIATTTGRAPQISVVEMPDGSDGKRNLGILYYSDDGNFQNGKCTGTLVIAPFREGSGIIHLMDTATNTIHAITYSVTAYTEGINIFRDNSLFAFRNANGSAYDPAQVQQSWDFRGNIPTWGSVNADVPYLSNLAYGNKSASFTFRTVAQSVDLYFNGTAEVKSTFPGFTPKTVSATGGTTKATVFFGANNTNYPHDVTVTVLSDTGAQFDRLVERYSGGEAPRPSDDAAAPHIYWSRSFPDTASIKTGENPVALTCYILDDKGIASVIFNGTEPVLTKNDAGFWQFNATVSQNGVLTVAALDSSGNRTARTVTVDWFNAAVSSGAIAAAPTLSVELLKNGAPLTGYVKQGESVFMAVTKENAATAAASYIAAVTDPDTGKTSLETTPLTAGTDGRFPVASNGYYQITATDGRFWRSVFLNMDRLDTAQPSVTLDETVLTGQSGEESGRALSWSASKGDTSLSPISQVTINEIAITTLPNNQTWVAGTLPISFGGLYTLRAKDGAGNISAPATYTVSDMVIDLSAADIFTVTHSWSQTRDNGSITIDSGRITGGLYDLAVFTASEAYAGSYEFSLLPKAEDFAFDTAAARKVILAAYKANHPDAPDMPAAELAAALAAKEAEARADWLEELMKTENDAKWTANTTISNLTPGLYTLYVRDAQEKTNRNVIAAQSLTVQDEAVKFSTNVKPAGSFNASDGAITVTASGGRLAQGTYQFAVLPMEKKDTPLVEVDQMAAWQLSDVAYGSLNTGTLSGLKPGWYQVAVRPMGVPTGTMSDLCTKRATLAAAQARLKKAEDANTVASLNSTAASGVAQVRTALQQWDAALAAPATAARLEDEYKALIENNVAIRTALNDWRTAKNSGTATPGQIAAAKQIYDTAVVDFAGTDAAKLQQIAAALSKWDAVLALGAAVTELETVYKSLIESDTGLLNLLSAWRSAESGVAAGTVTRAQADAAKLAYDDAVDVYIKSKTAANAAQELTDATAALATAKNSYDSAAQAAANAADLVYAATPELWTNAYTKAVQVNFYSADTSIYPSDLDYSQEGRIRVTFNADRTELSPSAVSTLIGKNAEYALVFTGSQMHVIIPAGTLSPGDDIMDMLLLRPNLPENPAGYVIRCTTADGKTYLVPMCSIGKDGIAYFAARPGRYSIVCNAVTFDDVETDFWGAEAIGFVTSHGLFLGTGADRFAPGDAMTRTMLVTVLGRLMGVDATEYTDKVFDDVPAGNWYSAYVQWAAENGIVSGYGNGRFGCNDVITREQMCTILVRFLKAQKVDLTENEAEQFSDAGSISDWAAEEMAFCQRVGLIQGVGGNRINPTGRASRAEVATLYMRLIESILNS